MNYANLNSAPALGLVSHSEAPSNDGVSLQENAAPILPSV